MSDEIECPECCGTGEERIGSLRLMCPFCHGRKVVGGKREQADEEPRAVWEHPVVRGSGLCPHCLGAGVVVAGGSYAEAPCPVCSGRGR